MTPPASALAIRGEGMTLEDFLSVVRPPLRKVALDPSAEQRMKASRAWVEQTARSGSGTLRVPIYGCNTGFGINREVAIAREDLARLSRNLLTSHASGTGPEFPPEVVRGAMLLRANALARGYSGCRPEIARTLLEMLNRGVTPVVPVYGSVGGSGDLAPLSHMALVLSRDPDGTAGGGGAMESGRARLAGSLEVLPGHVAMERAGIPGLVLLEKEALALNNGTQFITAVAALALAEALRVASAAMVAAAMTLEAVRGNPDFLDERLNAARGFPGQVQVASTMRRLVAGSRLIFDEASDRAGYIEYLEKRAAGEEVPPYPKEGVHDPYSIRTTPQVLGACLDAMEWVRNTVEREFNSVNDNPLILVEASRQNKSFSGGNFHGAPVAMAADLLKIASCEAGSISERRTALLLDSKFNRGLPDFLIEGRGLNSGLMVTQYLAAGLVAENRVLSHPASVDSVPTGNGFEDHVSMGTHGARQAREIALNAATIVAAEFLCAFQALHLREKQMRARSESFRPGAGTLAALDAVRSLGLEPYVSDRSPAPDVERIRRAILDGTLTASSLLNQDP